MSDAEERRRARAEWSVQIYRGEQRQQMDADDASFWLKIPVEERATVAWQLSEELFGLTAEPDTDERGFSICLPRYSTLRPGS